MVFLTVSVIWHPGNLIQREYRIHARGAKLFQRLLRVVIRGRRSRFSLTKLLHRLEQFLGVAVRRQIGAAALFDVPLAALDELCRFRHVITKARRGTAGIETCASENAGRNRTAEAWFFLVTHQ